MSKLSGTIGGINSTQVTVEFKLNSLFIKIEGHGDKTSKDGEGVPIMIDKSGGKVQVIIWSDINQKDPIVIDLSGALETKRNPKRNPKNNS